MPYPKLVAILRHGLKFLYKTATDLERRWLQEALFPQSLLLLKYIQTDPTRPKKDLQGKPINPAIEPSMHEHQVEMSESTPDSAYGVVEKQQKTAPNSVSPTAVKPELWKKQLLSGLAIMEKRLGKRVRLSSKKKVCSGFELCVLGTQTFNVQYLFVDSCLINRPYHVRASHIYHCRSCALINTTNRKEASIVAVLLLDKAFLFLFPKHLHRPCCYP